METSTVQEMGTNEILEKVVPAVQIVMMGAMKADGVQFSSSIKEASAAARYLASSQNTYKDNPIVLGTIKSLSQRKGEYKEKVDLRTLSNSEVMNKVDEVRPVLDGAGEQGAQTKTFIYGLAEAVVGASGTGFMGGGPKVTEGEAMFLSDLKTHLQV